MKKSYLILLFLFVSFFVAKAQDNSVTLTGVITDGNAKEPLVGATVLELGTTNGVVTDIDGKYSITLPSNATVQVTSIGFETITSTIDGKTSLDLTMMIDALDAGDVVITALGLKKEKKSLGYSFTELSGESLKSNTDANLMNALNGKVAGVQISPTGGGVGSSSRVIIRGNSTLGGNNQPLYVVDGVPITNNQHGNADDSDNGGVNSGDGMTSFNPDDIESMTVLKGPAATALYGTRAINGVILITTKTGKGNKGFGVEYSGNFSFDQAMILPKWQDQYGHGTGGKDPQDRLAAMDNYAMWGQKYNGSTSNGFWDGKTKEYRFYDNDKEFYQLGYNLNNSVSISHNTENSNVRFSYGNLTSQGIVENTDYNRHTFNLRGGLKAAKGILELDAKVTYTNEYSNNRPLTGASYYSPTSALRTVPNSYNINELRNYKDAQARPIGINQDGFNPYWFLHEVNNKDKKDRIIGMASVKLNLYDGLSLLVRGGTDLGNVQYNSIQPLGTPLKTQGSASQRQIKDMETNFDFLLNYQKTFAEKYSIAANFGGNMLIQTNSSTNVNSDDFTGNPSLQNPQAGKNKDHSLGYSKKRINSLYGTFQFGYDNYLFVDVSARNDWSSTLPIGNNSYFYPSVSLSFVFSQAFKLPEWVTFGKIRASWAQVGSDTEPYQLAMLYSMDSEIHGDVSSGGISGNRVLADNLKPSISSSWEVGFEMKFLQNRLGIDFTLYDQVAKDQILPVKLSQASGYDEAIINSGRVKNSGIEIALTGTPVQAGKFTWDVMANISANRNEVLDLAPGVEQFELIRGGGGLSVIAKPEQEYGVIMGQKFKRDPYGRIIIGSDGKFTAADGTDVIGSGVPKWFVGLHNTFSYGDFSLNISIDGKFGGDIYSYSESSAYAIGKHKGTIQGRDAFYGNGSWTPQGLVIQNGPGTYTPFTGNANPEDFYGSLSEIDEAFVYDASFIKLREVSFTWRLPSKWFAKDDKQFIQGLSLTAFGRNLCYLYKKTDNIDPETGYSSGNGQGLEAGVLPLTRNFGFSVGLKF